MAERPASPVRLIDVAERAGVSLTTASFAMSGRPGVSEPVAERIRRIAAELGYVPNMQARSLASGASSIIGLVVHDLADPYFAELASAVVESARELGLMVQTCQSSNDAEQEIQQVRALVAARVRAIIMAGSAHLNAPGRRAMYEELERFQATGGRVAMIGRHRSRLDAVVPRNRDGGVLVGAHVRQLGHTRIGICAGPEGLASAVDRLQGVYQGLASGNGRVRIALAHSPFTHDGGARAAEELLSTQPDITAIVALNDSTASGVLTAARARGLAVPRDLSVTGFSDVRVAESLGPGLTTAHLPLRTMGESAVQLALKAPAVRPRRHSVDATLVIRGSTAPPPRGSRLGNKTQPAATLEVTRN